MVLGSIAVRGTDMGGRGYESSRPGCVVVIWPSWWSVPLWLAYGVQYGSAMDSCWHECGRGTAFLTGWMNETAT